MKAAVFETFQGQISVEHVPDPEPKKDGVVLKVTATGMCRRDWLGWMGHDPNVGESGNSTFRGGRQGCDEEGVSPTR